MPVANDTIAHHPLTGEPRNSERGEWVRTGLDSFARTTFGGRTFTGMVEQHGLEGDAPTVIQDFITDGLHMAMAIGMTEDAAVEMAERAIRMFADEVVQEQDATEEAA
ncbi:hypothetical protein [Azospirillum sp. sgz302134]